jgi:hypothetical protein
MSRTCWGHTPDLWTSAADAYRYLCSPCCLRLIRAQINFQLIRTPGLFADGHMVLLGTIMGVDASGFYGACESQKPRLCRLVRSRDT